MNDDWNNVALIGQNEELADDISLLEILDHVLNSGVVIQGSMVISLGGVDLIYVGLNVVLTSVETALRHLGDGTSHRQRLTVRTKESA